MSKSNFQFVVLGCLDSVSG